MKQQGFSLIELVTVLLIITVLSTIAIRSTVDIGYNARYEQTKERLEAMKQAIIGNPNRYLNGQPDIHGFVADMGRLPTSIRELIQRQGDCDNNTYDYSSVDCIANGGTWDAAAWNDNSVSRVDSNVLHGWNGPYLTVSDNPANPDAYTDGWGRESIDNNYGWQLTYSTVGGASYKNVEIKSLGRDGVVNVGIACGDGEFIGDCSINISNTDYTVPVSEIYVQFQKPNGASAVIIPPVSFCSNPATAKNADRATCEAVSATWYGGCDKQGYFNKTDCEGTATGQGSSTWLHALIKLQLMNLLVCQLAPFGMG